MIACPALTAQDPNQIDRTGRVRPAAYRTGGRDEKSATKMGKNYLIVVPYRTVGVLYRRLRRRFQLKFKFELEFELRGLRCGIEQQFLVQQFQRHDPHANGHADTPTGPIRAGRIPAGQHRFGGNNLYRCEPFPHLFERQFRESGPGARGSGLQMLRHRLGLPLHGFIHPRQPE